MEHDTIAVVDFGGQSAHLIANKIRRKQVHAEILQPEDSTETFAQYKGIILSGSPALSAFDEDSTYNKGIFDLPIPILGFCFGHQEIAKHYGGSVINGNPEWGFANLHINREHPLFKGLSKVEQVFMSHNDSVTAIGPDFEELGYSVLEQGSKPHHFAVIGSDKHKRYGFQFHPELDDSIHGAEMLENFAIEICDCKPTWTMENFLEEILTQIRKQVGENSVFLLASGGVDSTVAAKLFAEALGADRLKLLHVDNGMMRKDESKQVLEMFREMGLGEQLHFIDASDDFLSSLEGQIEPEAKRAAIGKTFVDVFEREAKKLGIESYLLGQGTIYPDTVETGGTKRAVTIKTHHNRVPIIEEMIQAGRVVEPLSDLYKVEVRELGEMLGIPRKMIWRQPFPGPGLGVRLLCSDGKTGFEAAELARVEKETNAILSPYSIRSVPLPIKSVGLKADLRSYEHPLMLFADMPWGNLLEAAGTVLKGVKGINRCVLNLAPVEPKTFKPVAAEMVKERLDLLREADHIVMEALRRHKLYDKIWQCPTVFVPLEIDGERGELCIIRPIYSERAMSATAARLPETLITEVRTEILNLDKVVGLALDLTSKPPGTIEWE